MATSKTDAPPSLGELVPSIMGKFENYLYDRAARNAGYDPTSAYILGALTADHNDLEGPVLQAEHMRDQGEKDFGLAGSSLMKNPNFPTNLSQTAIAAERLKLIQDLIGHYGKRFGKPQKASKDDAIAASLKIT